jgi:CPA1 family monovalent cation:H+ antiporter
LRFAQLLASIRPVIHHVELQLLLLLLTAAVVGVGARYLRVPYTLALVAAGIALGFADLSELAEFELSADLLLFLLLPALLFEAAFHIEWEEFRRELVPILMLAVFGVLVAVSATAGLAYAALGLTGLAPGFELAHAFIFAAVIAATDPISVLALFRELGVGRRLYLLVEGESLLNDGIAVVVFTIVLVVFGISWAGKPPPVLDGTGEIASHALVTLVRMAIGGALIGATIGGIVSFVTRQIDDHLIEITLTMLVAYGSFLVAETIHVSGVLSTVCAGLMVGSVGATKGMSPATKNAVEDFWEYMAFLANSLIFLLVGLQLDIGQLAGTLGAIVLGFVVMIGARALAVYTMVPLANTISREVVPRVWRHVMVWGGLRGSLSMVLVLILPADLPGKAVLVNVVFGVVALSLFVQGLTMRPLLRKLGLLGSDPDQMYHRARTREIAAQRALEELEHLRAEGFISGQASDALEDWYQNRRKDAAVDAMSGAGRSELDEQLTEGLRRLADAERESLRRSRRAGLIAESALAELDTEILDRLHKLEHAEESGEDALSAHLSKLFESKKSDE